MQDLIADMGTIRKLWPGETDKYRDHLLRLDEESRRRRFGGKVSEQYIQDHAASARGLDTVLYGFFVHGVLRGAAELRLIGPRFLNRAAEAAFSVEAPWQSHGVGSALLERALLTARNRGAKFLHMTCLIDNRRMQQLARKFEAELTFDFGSAVGELEAPRPTPMSLLRELVNDSQSIATALLDAQTKFLKTG